MSVTLVSYLHANQNWCILHWTDQEDVSAHHTSHVKSDRLVCIEEVIIRLDWPTCFWDGTEP